MTNEEYANQPHLAEKRLFKELRQCITEWRDDKDKRDYLYKRKSEAEFKLRNFGVSDRRIRGFITQQYTRLW